MIALVGFAWLALLLVGAAVVLALVGMAGAVVLAARHAIHTGAMLRRLDVAHAETPGFFRGFSTGMCNFLKEAPCIGC